jgi:hypothetical protein
MKTAHFVTFLSPGTMVAEQSTKPVESWDVDAAVKMARGVKERHGAVPYGFYFTTRERDDNDLDSREPRAATSTGSGGRSRRWPRLRPATDPKESILRSNMRINGWDRVVVNDNSWRWDAAARQGRCGARCPLLSIRRTVWRSHEPATCQAPRHHRRHRVHRPSHDLWAGGSDWMDLGVAHRRVRRVERGRVRRRAAPFGV